MRTLIKDKLAESHELQFNTLAQLQVFLSSYEKFDELAWQGLLNALNWTHANSFSRGAFIEHATLADDGRLHTKRRLRHRQRFQLSFSCGRLVCCTATASILRDEGWSCNHSVSLHAVCITENVSSLIGPCRVLADLRGSQSALGRLYRSQCQISLDDAGLLL